MGLCRCLNVRNRLNEQIAAAELHVLLLIVLFGFLFSLLCGYGLDFCSVNFRKERLGCSGNRHFAQ